MVYEEKIWEEKKSIIMMILMTYVLVFRVGGFLLIIR